MPDDATLTALTASIPEAAFKYQSSGPDLGCPQPQAEADCGEVSASRRQSLAPRFPDSPRRNVAMVNDNIVIPFARSVMPPAWVPEGPEEAVRTIQNLVPGEGTLRSPGARFDSPGASASDVEPLLQCLAALRRLLARLRHHYGHQQLAGHSRRRP